MIRKTIGKLRLKELVDEERELWDRLKQNEKDLKECNANQFDTTYEFSNYLKELIIQDRISTGRWAGFIRALGIIGLTLGDLSNLRKQFKEE